MGQLQLRGRSTALAVFEPVDPRWRDSGRLAEYREAYALLSASDPRAAQAFESLSSRYPDDPLVQFHRRRLSRGEHGEVVNLEASSEA